MFTFVSHRAKVQCKAIENGAPIQNRNEKWICTNLIMKDLRSYTGSYVLVLLLIRKMPLTIICVLVLNL